MRLLRFLFAVLAVSCLLMGQGLAQPAGTITDLRLFKAEGNVTRIIVDATRAAPYRAFVLQNPMRLVVDFPLMGWSAPMNKGDRYGRIKAYRHSVFQKDTRRIVFDLNTPMIIARHKALPPESKRPWQYVFDLQPASGVQFQQQVHQVKTGNGAPSAAVKGTAAADDETVQPLRAPKDKLPEVKTADPATPKTTATMTASAVKKIPLIVIDAGHGGPDSGAIATNGVYEKNITLAMAQRVRDLLIADGRYRVKLTRDSDVFIKLPMRVKIARDVSADLFISLHADTIMRPTVQGASVYTLSETASDAETAKLAERENAVDSLVNVDVGKVDADVADILLDLVTRDTMNQSKVLAETVVKTFHSRDVVTLPQRPHRFAGFAVLKAPDIPSILIEMGYLSNRAEADRLNSKAYQEHLAQAIAATVDRFFGNKVLE